MKVALLSSLYAPYNVGGTEKAVLMLAEALSAHGTEVVVISLHPGDDEVVENWNGVRVYRLPIDNVYFPWLGGDRPTAWQRMQWHLRDMWNWKAAKRVASVLQQERPDVLHTHSVSGFSVAVWAAAKRLKIARLHTLQDYYPLCVKTTLYRNGSICKERCIDCKALTWTRKLASADVDAVAGITEFILQRHTTEGYFEGAQKQVVTHIQRALPAAPKGDDGVLTFGFIGRVTRDKGIELLLEAMARLKSERCELKIAGRVDPDYFAALQERFPDERVRWMGFVPEQEFFSQVDVVVIPSVWEEPLAYTCIESLFAGKSVLAADTGGLSEIARLVPLHRLFKAGDAGSLTSAMKAVLDEPATWKQTRAAAPEVLNAFSEETVIAQYQAMYRSIASAKD
jgi:glycosyltransferase involved in cell wall biosynthesis